MYLAVEAWQAVIVNSDPADLQAFRSAVMRDVPHVSCETAVAPVTEEAFFVNLGDALAVVALLHDVGHPPYSHALEWIYVHWAEVVLGPGSGTEISQSGMPFHEYMGLGLARELSARHLTLPAVASVVAAILDKNDERSWVPPLRSIVDSEIDIDRIDYLLRDNRSAGTEYGAFDFERLISSVELVRNDDDSFVVGLGSRARSGAEQLLLQRMQTYRWIIFHPRIVAADHAIARAIDELLQLSVRSDVLSTNDGSSEVDVGELFARLIPALNYLKVDVATIAERMGMVAPSTLQLGAGAGIAQLELEARAGVDDGSVNEWLKDGISSARLVMASCSPNAELAGALDRVILFGTTVTTRSKRMMPAWKNHEEYEETARAIVEDASFRETVEQSWAKLEEEFGPSDRLQALRSADLAVLHGYDPSLGRRSSIEVFNHFAGILVDRAGAQLSAYLNANASPPYPGASGFWESTFRDFRPLRRLSSASRLFKGDTQISLQETSPLVRSLRWVDDQRTKLFVFYCKAEATAAPAPTAELRLGIRSRFVETFTAFVAEQYPLAQRELFIAPSEGI